MVALECLKNLYFSMKICYLTSEYPHAKIKHAAGIGTSIKNLAITLVKKENDWKIISYTAIQYDAEGEDVDTLERE
mgnify:CR=1 FL=1